MKAVLVGSVDNARLYYVLDAQEDEFDGIIERDNGLILRVDFFSFVAKARDISKFRTTRFHRFLWDKPSPVMQKTWNETFLKKSRELNKNMLEDVIVVSSVGRGKQKVKTKSDAVNMFLQKNENAITKVSEGCCGQMVKSIQTNFIFESPEARLQAWAAMRLLRELEN